MMTRNEIYQTLKKENLIDEANAMAVERGRKNYTNLSNDDLNDLINDLVIKKNKKECKKDDKKHIEEYTLSFEDFEELIKDIFEPTCPAPKKEEKKPKASAATIIDQGARRAIRAIASFLGMKDIEKNF